MYQQRVKRTILARFTLFFTQSLSRTRVDNPQKLFDAIPQYLTETLGLKREDENLYRSKDACYDIVYCKGENSFFLMSKAMTEEQLRNIHVSSNT